MLMKLLIKISFVFVQTSEQKKVMSNFHCWSKSSSTAFFQKDHVSLFHLCAQEFPFLSALRGNEGRCRFLWSVWRIHTKKENF